ncbi:MAG: bile acid:sodium symporter family protein [Aureispira sp.]|nr:bile acid:sodium symporter family protein [Aureispira sp.]
MDIDNAVISFDGSVQSIMKVILGLVIFGVALDIKVGDFKQVFSTPKAVLLGLVAQFFIFPALTFLIIYLASLSPQTAFYPSVALGMLLVAACPGGNMSNFFSNLAKGNTALSVTMSAVSTVAAVIMTPFNFSFWGSILPETEALLQTLSISFMDMFQTIMILLCIPLVAGMAIAHYFPKVAAKARTPMKMLSISFFVVLIIGAFAANYSNFINYVGGVVLIVFIQNSIALFTGFSLAKMVGLSERDSRTVSIEVGIQNSGLGLILFFEYFNTLGGMGIIIAWWSIWHMISGLSLATYWSKKTKLTNS